jgi:hypothetical protein
LESGLLDHGGLVGSQRLALAGSCGGAGHEEPSAAADSREGGWGTLRRQAPDPIERGAERGENQECESFPTSFIPLIN